VTPGEIAAIFVGLAGLLTAIGKILVDRDEKRNAAARDEAKAEAAEEKARIARERWIVETVTKAVNVAVADERAKYAAAVGERDARIKALEDEVQMLATMFARGIDRTPTQAEWSQLYAIFERHNITLARNTSTEHAE
jgi:hypothetical protein